MTRFAQFVTFGKPPVTLYSQTIFSPTANPTQIQFPMAGDPPLNLADLDTTRDAVLAFRLRLWGYVHLTMTFNGQPPFLDYDISQVIPGVPRVWNEIISGSKENPSILKPTGNQFTIAVGPAGGSILGISIPFPGRIDLSRFVLTYHADDSQPNPPNM